MFCCSCQYVIGYFYARHCFLRPRWLSLLSMSYQNHPLFNPTPPWKNQDTLKEWQHESDLLYDRIKLASQSFICHHEVIGIPFFFDYGLVFELQHIITNTDMEVMRSLVIQCCISCYKLSKKAWVGTKAHCLRMMRNLFNPPLSLNVLIMLNTVGSEQGFFNFMMFFWWNYLGKNMLIPVAFSWI